MKKTLYITPILLFILFLTLALYAQQYKVGEGDVIKISVYDNEDLQTTVRVSGEGHIVVPLLGKVSVEKLTIPEISDKLTNLYADGYLVSPQVNVFIEEYRGQKAVILGEVNHPGLFELRGTTTFLELVSKAGGLTQDAGEKAIIKRKLKDSYQHDQKIIAIDLISLMEKGDFNMNLQIIDGDNIYISKTGFFYVTGEVKKPDAYKFLDGTTVIQAIAMAGGFTGKANEGKVKIHRKIEEQEKIIEVVALDTPIYQNDVIIVPESFF
ncbi:MAG: polysaccharide export protein [Proteobacteria bacterium]|nr:polysaccharide export protein [Pseudomonadota bacterium]